MKKSLFIPLLIACWISTARADVYNDNVVILLDASGSMQDAMQGAPKMDAAKRAIAEVLQTVPETTQVGLLVFSGSRKSSDWVFPLGPRDDAKLLGSLRPIEPGGGTPLGRYIKVAADRLLQAREGQLGYGSYRLLIVTDGEAGDRKLVNRHAPAVIARGILMDVIGVAMNQNHTLATLAHSYRRADDPASLRRAIADVLGEVSAAGGGGPASAEAFSLLEGIPDELALAMIQALASTDNRPISPLPSDGEDGVGAAPGHAAPPGGGNPPGSIGKRIGIGVVAMIVLYMMFGKAKRRRR